MTAGPGYSVFEHALTAFLVSVRLVLACAALCSATRVVRCGHKSGLYQAGCWVGLTCDAKLECAAGPRYHQLVALLPHNGPALRAARLAHVSLDQLLAQAQARLDVYAEGTPSQRLADLLLQQDIRMCVSPWALCWLHSM